MAEVINIDDEVSPPTQSNPIAPVSISELQDWVDYYRNYAVSNSGNDPNDVVVATTISRQTINRLLDESRGDAIRIYLVRESATTDPDDTTFLIVPVKETEDFSNKYIDSISDTSGTVLKMAACPSAVCPTDKMNTYLLNNR